MYESHARSRTQQNIEDQIDALAMDMAREEAAAEAVQAPLKLQEEEARRVLRRKGVPCMEDTRKAVTEARKQRMRTVQQYLCDRCDHIIQDPSAGFVIQGNIYVADPCTRGGVVGDNFPEPDEEGKIKLDAIRETVLCQTCLFSILGMLGVSPKSPKESTYRGILNPTDLFDRLKERASQREEDCPF